jgi:6-pyruvoyltetrahydropterin/6-carboxytetrahydropterin synthase
MFTVTKTIDFCYGHRLLKYEGRCRHLHGHNGRIEVDIDSTDLDGRGMVTDFSEIKRALKSWIDETLDHQMILCKDDPLVPVLKQKGELFYVIDDNPTAENIAKLIFEYARSKGLPVKAVRLWETPTSCAGYRA